MALGTASSAQAQTFLDHLQDVSGGRGRVTVTQSDDIDKLVNGADVSGSAYSKSQREQQKPAADKAETGTVTAEKKGDTTATKHAADLDDEEEEAQTPVGTSQRKHKINGYRVQLYSGGNSRESKNRAYNIGNSAKRAMPEQSVYVHFNSPRWYCRMGNFRTYEEASVVLREMKDLGYTDACIVSDKISVSY